MKRLFTFLIIFILFLVASQANNAKAFSCTGGCSADPTSGPLNEGFTVNGNGCTAESSITSVAILSAAGTSLNAIPVTLNNGSFSVSVPPIGATGEYLLVLTDAGFTPSSCGTFTANPPEEGEPGLQCGSTTATYSEDCPASCPSRLQTASLWICGCGRDGESCCPPGNLAGLPECVETGSVCRADQCYGVGWSVSTAALVQGNCSESGTVHTAIGCIPFRIISQTASFFLAWSLSIGGGVALLLVGLSGIMFATSAGNPQRIKSAQDLFWAAITGLGMLILSVFLLRFIGVDVLSIFG